MSVKQLNKRYRGTFGTVPFQVFPFGDEYLVDYPYGGQLSHQLLVIIHFILNYPILEVEKVFHINQCEDIRFRDRKFFLDYEYFTLWSDKHIVDIIEEINKANPNTEKVLVD